MSRRRPLLEMALAPIRAINNVQLRRSLLARLGGWRHGRRP